MIILENNCAFLHIPKTGGTFVTNVLGNPPWEGRHKHKILSDASLTAFCFVRHPLDWYESYWRWLAGYEGRGGDFTSRPGHPLCPLSNVWDPDFNKTIAACIEQSPGFLTTMFQSYTRDCKHIGRQESLRADLIGILEKCGLKATKDVETTDRQNISLKKQVVWDGDLKDEILKLEHHIITEYY